MKSGQIKMYFFYFNLINLFLVIKCVSFRQVVMRIFILITSILPVILSADDFTFPKEEERKCKGKCVRALECEIALNTNKVKGFRPEICFFYLQDPYVCCPIKGLNGTITGTFLGQTLSDKSE